MAEDLQWALDAMKKGYRLYFAHRSVVYHSHEYSPLGAYRRYREDARAVREILGLPSRQGALHALKGFLHELSRDFRYLSKLGPGAVFRYGPCAPVLRAFQVAGQWRGSR
jgi:hypothetical protein